MVEAEAKRMAHALHDEAGQLLTAVHLKLADAARTVPTDCQSCFAEVRTLLDQIELQLRSLSHELNPAVLEQRGLAPAIQLLADGVACRTGIQVSVRSALTRRYALNVETAIYRAVQEALTNVSRHSQATRATIRLQEEGRRLHCVIRDNGVGFRPDAESAGMGLNGMRMRAEALGGRIKIRSTPGAGTELVVIVPAEQHETPA